MPEGIKLDELEAYRAEALNAEREGRPCRYRNPREVFAEDPNLDSYLIELTDDELKEAELTRQDELDKQAEVQAQVDEELATNMEGSTVGDNLPYTVSPTPDTSNIASTDASNTATVDSTEENPGAAAVKLADPGQEQAEAAALAGANTESTHQNTQSTPNPEHVSHTPESDVSEVGDPDFEPDNPQADNPPADNPPADNPPADNPPADNPTPHPDQPNLDNL